MKTLRTVNSMKRLDLSTPQDFLLLYNLYNMLRKTSILHMPLTYLHLPLRRAY